MTVIAFGVTLIPLVDDPCRLPTLCLLPFVLLLLELLLCLSIDALDNTPYSLVGLPKELLPISLPANGNMLRRFNDDRSQVLLDVHGCNSGDQLFVVWINVIVKSQIAAWHLRSLNIWFCAENYLLVRSAAKNSIQLVRPDFYGKRASWICNTNRLFWQVLSIYCKLYEYLLLWCFAMVMDEEIGITIARLRGLVDRRCWFIRSSPEFHFESQSRIYAHDWILSQWIGLFSSCNFVAIAWLFGCDL